MTKIERPSKGSWTVTQSPNPEARTSWRLAPSLSATALNSMFQFHHSIAATTER